MNANFGLKMHFEKQRFNKPYGFNIDIRLPTDYVLKTSKDSVRPMIKMDLELSNLDNKATLLYALQYIRFLEERLPKIINKLNFADTQKYIDSAYKKATQSIEGYTPNPLEENKKRKMDLKMLQVKWLDTKYTNALLKSYNFCL